MGGEIIVRRYRAEDRAAVRLVAYETGYLGDSAKRYWRDFPSFADIWTSYYTDHEPKSVFVAEGKSGVVGYLVGCVESAHAPTPAAALARQLIRRALLLRSGTAGFLWRSIWDAARQRQSPTGVLNDRRWPSHLHVNLLHEARGRGVGSQLMKAWFWRLREVGSPGCHLATLTENTTALAFFERMGFRHLGAPMLIPGMRLPSGGRMHLQLMVKESCTISSSAAGGDQQ